MSSTTTETVTSTPQHAEQVSADQLQVGNYVAATKKAVLAAEGATVGQITSPNGRIQLRYADGKMIRSCEPTTKMWRSCAAPTETPEETVSTETETPKSTTFEWPTEPSALLAEYLVERTSPAHDAPTRYLPTVTAGVLRVHGSDWMEYLESKKVGAPKKLALAVLKDAGLVQKVYALPGTDGKSAGFYTGSAPAGLELEERVVQRGGSRGPRTPFGKLTDEQRALLVKVLGAHKAQRDQVLRDQLLAHLEPAGETTPDA